MVDIVLKILYEAWILTLEMAPYLLLGFIAAGVLHVMIPIETIGKHLGKESIGSVIKASLFGVPIPLCSCGVLPVAASLRKSGAGKSSTLSFLITTPVTGVDSLMATWALLGWVITLARVAASIVIGFFTGIVMILGVNKEKTATSVSKPLYSLNPKVPLEKIGTITVTDINTDSCSRTDCCGTEESSADMNIIQKIKAMLHYAFIELPSDFAGSLFLGLLLAGIISAFISPEHVHKYVTSNFAGIIIATLIAIPLYVCATGSIPIAAALIAGGFSPGAALAFLIAGPATNTIAILTIKQLLGKKALFLYLFFIFTGAIGFGYLLDMFNFKWIGNAVSHNLNPQDSPVKLISGIILLALITFLYFKDKFLQIKLKQKIKSEDKMDNKIKLSAPDISCSHCVMAVKKGLSVFQEIKEIDIDTNSKLVYLTIDEGMAIDKGKILSAMESAGYPATVKE